MGFGCQEILEVILGLEVDASDLRDMSHLCGSALGFCIEGMGWHSVLVGLCIGSGYV